MTETENRFMRQLRDLLKFHGVKLRDKDIYDSDDSGVVGTDYAFEGPEIYLSLHTVSQELEQP